METRFQGNVRVPDRKPLIELIPVRRTATRDHLLTAGALIVLALSLLKPWGSPAPAVPATETPPREAALPPATATPLRADMPISLSPEAFVPPAASCLVDGRWRVCVFGTPGDGRAIHAWLFAPAPQPPEPLAYRTEPALVLLTATGAGIGFYPLSGHGTGAPEHLAASVWYIAPGAGLAAREPLRLVKPALVGQVVGTAYLAAAEGFASDGDWPAGDYMVILSGGEGWMRPFSFEVLTAPAG